MIDERRQEIFRDAEPAAEGGTFRVVAAMVGFAILVAIGWLLVSLNELREDLKSLQDDEMRRVVVLNADLESLKKETSKEFHSVKNALSGVWHKHKPAELEVMGFLASLDHAEREAMLARVRPSNSGRKSSGIGDSGRGSDTTNEATLVSPEKPIRVSPARPLSTKEVATDEERKTGGGGTALLQDEKSSDRGGLKDQKRQVRKEENANLGSLQRPGTSAPAVRVSPPARGDNDPGGAREYTIQPGDSLSGIAFKHQVSSSALAEANGITNPNRIRVGQVLKIP